MNKSVHIPPRKRIRLCAASTNNSNHSNANANNHKKDFNYVFEWTKPMIKLLIFGFVRDNINFAIPDISLIIYLYLLNMLLNYHINNNKYSNIKYMSNNNIICNFTINGENMEIDHNWSTIIFTPYLSDVFNNTDINDLTTKVTQKMKISLKKNECNGLASCCFQCGIIGIPLIYKKDLKILKNSYENVKRFTHDHFSLSGMENIDPMPFLNCNSYFAGCDCPTSTRTYGYGHYTYIETYRNYFCHRFLDTNDKSDCIEVCIDYIMSNNEYYLYFMRNNQILGTKKSEKEFINGKIKLNFNNNDYLFALSSPRCECQLNKNVKGFEYEVSMSATFE